MLLYLGIQSTPRPFFWTVPRPRPVSLFEVERYRYRVWSRFLKLNDTDTESGLVFWNWTIPIPSLVSCFLSERYRYRVRSCFFKVNDTETETRYRTPKSPRLQRDETETKNESWLSFSALYLLEVLLSYTSWYIYELANNPTHIDDNWPLHNKINSVSVIVIPDTPTTPPIVPNPNKWKINFTKPQQSVWYGADM